MSAIYFAWVDSSETTFLNAHKREDEKVFEFKIDHAEGQFPTFGVWIRNPSVGLLSAGRKTWAWLRYENGAAARNFLGRLVAVPKDLFQEEVFLEFECRPTNVDDQREAIAAAYRAEGAPYWDPIWIAEERHGDPEAVFDARPERWHIDPSTLIVTASNIIVGEDGTISLDGGDILEGSLTINPGPPPARSCEVKADIHWLQQAAGTVNLTGKVIQVFADAGTTDSYKVSSYTGEGLQRDWPPQGTAIGAGWSIGESSLERADGWGVEEEFNSITTSDPWTVHIGTSSFLQMYPEVRFPLWRFWPVLKVDYAAERSFKEKVSFTLEADVQATHTDPGDDEKIILPPFASRSVSEPIEDDGSQPIKDVRRRAYLPTNRGQRSLKWLILRARAELLNRARTVEVSCEVPFETGLAFTCRKNLRLFNCEPLDVVGGEAVGKIIAYSLFGNGDTGVFGCTVVIGCTVGQGGTVSAAPGDTEYVDDEYVESDYQISIGEIVAALENVVTYDDYSSIEPGDDGIDFLNMTPNNIIDDSSTGGIFVNGGQADQEAVLAVSVYASWSEAAEALNAVFTELCFSLKPLNGGPFETSYPITVSRLMVPKTVDLEIGESG